MKNRLPFLLGAALFCAPFSPSVLAQDEPRSAETLTASGEMAPDFRVRKLDGRTVSLGAMRGKIVVLNLFATWCPSCREEMPYLQAIYNRHKGPDFEMLAISRDEPQADVARYVAQNRFTLPFALDIGRTTYSRYATKWIPRTYLIGPTGHILYQMIGSSPEEMAQIDATIAAIKRSPDGKKAFAWRRKNAAKIAQLTSEKASGAGASRPGSAAKAEEDKGIYILDEQGRRRLD